MEFLSRLIIIPRLFIKERKVSHRQKRLKKSLMLLNMERWTQVKRQRRLLEAGTGKKTKCALSLQNNTDLPIP